MPSTNSFGHLQERTILHHYVVKQNFFDWRDFVEDLNISRMPSSSCDRRFIVFCVQCSSEPCKAEKRTRSIETSLLSYAIYHPLINLFLNLHHDQYSAAEKNNYQELLDAAADHQKSITVLEDRLREEEVQVNSNLDHSIVVMHSKDE